MSHYVGLDVSLKEVSVCVVDRDQRFNKLFRKIRRDAFSTKRVVGRHENSEAFGPSAPTEVKHASMTQPYVFRGHAKLNQLSTPLTSLDTDWSV